MHQNVTDQEVSKRSEEALVGVILTAGRSQRMGVPKHGLHWEGQSLLERALSLLERIGVSQRSVVVSAETRAQLPALPGDVRMLLNPRPEDGQSSSVRLAAQAAVGAGLVLFPVDHAPVRASTMDLLASAFRQRTATQQIVVPSHGGRRGHPAFFGARATAELAALAQGEPAHSVVRRAPERVHHVETDDLAVVLDLDRPEDLESLRRRREGAGS